MTPQALNQVLLRHAAEPLIFAFVFFHIIVCDPMLQRAELAMQVAPQHHSVIRLCSLQQS